MESKKVFAFLFVFLSILVMVLPVVLTFNDVLTRLIEKVALYQFIQEKIVPYEVFLTGVIVKPFVKEFIPFSDGMVVNGIPLRMTWNCLGWQSLLLFLGSLIVGLKSGRYTLISKIEVITLGILGIFWINLLRIAFIVLLSTWSQSVYRIVFHDYLAAITTIIFLFGFWWFSYRFILEERQPSVEKEAVKV
jgi:exosortase/archaeosortase family protein